jgi:hypothetical protein
MRTRIFRDHVRAPGPVPRRVCRLGASQEPCGRNHHTMPIQCPFNAGKRSQPGLLSADRQRVLRRYILRLIVMRRKIKIYAVSNRDLAKRTLSRGEK